MKSPLKALGALAAAGALFLAGCGGTASTQSTGPQSAPGTRTIVDHAGNQVELPAQITRVAIDQIPIESTYLAYFDGKAPYLVAMSAARVKAMSDTIAAQMAPEMLQVQTDYYDNGELNAESLASIGVDVVLYNAFNKIALGKDLVAGARERASRVAEADRQSTMVLMGAADGQLAVAGGRDGWFTDSWAESLNYTNVTADTDTSHTPVTFEQVLAWDPQVLLVTGKGMSNMTAKSVLDNTVEGVDFSTLSSVRSGRVYSTGLGMWNWFTPNPDSPVVANWLGKSLYPDQFADVDLVSITKDYYQRMYSFTLTDAQALAIVDPDSAS